MDVFVLAAAVGIASLLANLFILALNLKLYTEIMKEWAQQRRHEREKAP